MVSNKLMLRKLYFKTNDLDNFNNIIWYDIIYWFYLFNITFKTKINSVPVLKFHGDAMMRCPVGNCSAKK